MNLSVVILAAGNGKRMKSSLPKVLHCLGGVPILHRVINTSHTLNADGVYVVYGNGKQQVLHSLAGLKVTPVEQKEPKGTGDALLKAIYNIPDDHRVLVLYGDVPLIRKETLNALIEQAPADGIGLLISNVVNPTGLGRIIRNHSNDIVAIVEHKDASPEELLITEVNTGILTAPAKLLKKWLPQLKNSNAQGEFYLTDIIALAVNENKSVKGCLVCNKEVSGVNDRKELAILERYYQSNLAVEFLLQGVYIIDPARFDCRGSAQIAQDVTIDINVILEGQVFIDTGSKIGANCVLKNVHIGKNVEVRPNCVIENATIDDGCVIGPFARIRPETCLEKDVHIGNFVELKKTQVGANSKVNHLTYLGDAILGSGVNVGAGTITCNYDGTHKHLTIIKDNAFIGSGTELVAPVEIEEGAYIGAGSTITQNAPAHQLTVSRAKQVTVKGWKKKVKNAVK